LALASELSARFSFQFALSAMEVPKFENYWKIKVRNCPIMVNLRQVIGSNSGKELVQVTDEETRRRRCNLK
jgi:hypothetical protein